MSTIITQDMASGKPKIIIYAPDCRTSITGTDLDGYIIHITGEAEKPFIDGVRFIGCTVIAENMRAFNQCYFDDDCEMVIKEMPKVTHTQNTAETINHNRVGVDA